jgi:D-psicose/D-tagatose/L-ribulose 3-epimerase
MSRPSTRPFLQNIKKAGYDTVEIPVFEGTPEHYARLGQVLDKLA